jgi:hypothetical protein
VVAVSDTADGKQPNGPQDRPSPQAASRRHSARRLMSNSIINDLALLNLPSANSGEAHLLPTNRQRKNPNERALLYNTLAEFLCRLNQDYIATPLLEQLRMSGESSTC